MLDGNIRPSVRDFGAAILNDCTYLYLFTSARTFSLFTEESVSVSEMRTMAMFAVGNILLLVLRIMFESLCCRYRVERYAH